MKRKPNKFLLLFIACLFFLSCENNVVPVVSNSTGSSSKGLLPPENVTAVGGKKKITLIWSPSSNATHYSIYAAPTQFDKFVKIGESTTTTYTYNVGAGLTRYFKVVAENERTNASSDDSLIAKGFTLAQPIITSIDSYMDGNDSVNKIFWYMSNLEDYQEYVQYEIKCYNGSSIIQEVTVAGNSLSDESYIFKNLPQNKTIQFEVAAYLSNEQSVIETSTKLDIVTAARQTPDPVAGLKASYGIASDKIELEFELPDYSYVKNNKNEFDEHAIYFQIFRREQRADSTDDDWVSINNQLCCNGQPVTSTALGDYTPGTLFTYTDETNLVAGKKYEYKIQSYVQGVNAEITSPTHSVATTMGWTCGIPLLMTDIFEYEKDEISGEKVSAWLDFKASWNNFGNENEYKFLLESTRTKKGLPTEITYKLFDTTTEINKEIKYFNLEKELGTYKFKLYVVKAEGAEATAECAATAFVSKEASDEILVSILKSLPELKIFEKDDGYKDKVILSWDDERSKGATSYNLLRYVVDSNGYKTDDLEKEFADVTSGVDAVNGIFTYTDYAVESGKRYKYTLIAKALEDPSDTSSELDVPSTPIIAETLGTPKPNFDNNSPKHDKIIITWNKVLKADDDSYTVELKDGTTKISTGEIKIEKNNDNTFTCEIQKPAGYNDAEISGKEWTAYVTASSKKDNNTIKDTTEGTKNVRTLGPVGIIPTATVSKSTSQIKVTWKKIPGAKKYAIKRTRYEVTDTSFTNPIENGTDIYYVTANGGISDSLDSASTTILLNNNDNTFTLTDTCKQLEKAEGASPLAINQDRLSWGYPYRYTIIPLENSSLEIDDTGTISLPENQKLEYTNIDVATATGSCIGYGHNVRATKAEDPYTITITYDMPYGIEDKSNAKLYYKKEEDKSWTRYDTATFDQANYTFTFTPTSSNENPRTGTYLFAVGYGAEKPHETYFKYSTDKTDTKYSPTESLNKGYTYSLELTAAPVIENNVLSLKETFTWTLWDYSKRAIGPDKNAKIELCLFNNDFVVITSSDDGWRAIAEIDKDGNLTPYDESKNPKYNVAFVDGKTTATSVQIKLKPKNLKDANHQWYNGLLKVQRDYKHYAKLKCDRPVVDVNGNPVKIQDPNDSTKTIEKVATLSWADKDTTKGDLLVYGYRNFTDGEIARMAMLILSYGFYINDSNGDTALQSMGQFKYGNADTHSGATQGSVKFGKKAPNGTKGKASFYFNDNYNCSILTPGGKSVITPLGITTLHDNPSAALKTSSDADPYLYGFRTDFSITLKTSVAASTSDFSNDYSEYSNIFDATIGLIYTDSDMSKKKTFAISIKRGVHVADHDAAEAIFYVLGEDKNLFGKVTGYHFESFKSTNPPLINTTATYSDGSSDPNITSWCPIQMWPDTIYRFKDTACDWWGE